VQISHPEVRVSLIVNLSCCSVLPIKLCIAATIQFQIHCIYQETRQAINLALLVMYEYHSTCVFLNLYIEDEFEIAFLQVYVTLCILHA